MSQHPSLKSHAKEKAHRSVWKRFERLKFLVEKDKWAEGNSIFGLPKIKLLKLKIKKEKAAETAAEGVGAEGAAAEGVTPSAAAAGEKGGVPPTIGAAGKGAPGKEAGKQETKGTKKPEKPEKK
jgi:small basic protein (TIGR04137 family)